MSSELIPVSHQQRLRRLIANPATINVSEAACAGIDPDIYHPGGDLDDVSKARCGTCTVPTACLALALAAEDPSARAGWYGGYGPRQRDEIAAALGIDDRPARKALELRAAGLTINQIAAQLSCSRRTIQRYLATR